jgi:hypothetical protein
LWKGKKQTPSAPKIFNGGKGGKTIRQSSNLQNTATADFFLFQRSEVKAGELSLSKAASSQT